VLPVVVLDAKAMGKLREAEKRHSWQ